jgi:RHS repeat-associated protein
VKPDAVAAASWRGARHVGLAFAGILVLLLSGLGLVATARTRSWRAALAALLAITLLLPGCGTLFGTSDDPIWRATRTTYFHTGFAAGPLLLTSENATVVDERRYEPFGHAIDSIREPSGFSAVVDYAREPFNGLNKPTDSRTGWSYHGARWMAPQTGRWLTPDPPVTVPDRSFIENPWGLHPYQYVDQNPTLYWDEDGEKPVLIGRIYVLRTARNEVYGGSTAQELRSRFRTHQWRKLLNAKGTSLMVYDVTAEINVQASNRGTIRSALNEALRTVEQQILNEVATEKGVKTLNRRAAATESNMAIWRQRHKVSVGRGVATSTLLRASAAASVFSMFMMYREEKVSKYATAPYLLEDEGGVFAIEERGGLFEFNTYHKNYKAGDRAGQSVEIGSDEFDFWQEEAESLWGGLDWLGDFVPGFLQRTLPPAYNELDHPG